MWSQYEKRINLVKVKIKRLDSQQPHSSWSYLNAKDTRECFSASACICSHYLVCQRERAQTQKERNRDACIFDAAFLLPLQSTYNFCQGPEIWLRRLSPDKDAEDEWNWNQLGSCFCYFSCCQDKTPDTHELKKQRFLSAHRFEFIANWL